jgi:hypothetical protein
VEKYCRAGQATYDRQYGTCTLRTGYLRIQIHRGYEVLTASPLQQWLHKHASLLLYMYIAVGINFFNTKPGVVQSVALVKLKQKNRINFFLKLLCTCN